jgi:hypothetical protein
MLQVNKSFYVMAEKRVMYSLNNLMKYIQYVDNKVNEAKKL